MEMSFRYPDLVRPVGRSGLSEVPNPLLHNQLQL